MLGLMQSRIELFAVELQEEKLRLIGTIVWLVIALALIVAGLLVGLGAVALYLWDVARYFGIVGLALALLTAGASVLWAIRRQIRSNPVPFAETISEFDKDRKCLRGDK
jgi:uncharacterized membrane protein YqjE